MKVLVTGAKGFIGKHLVTHLTRRGHEVFEFDKDNTDKELEKYVNCVDFIVHLAGINRPLTNEEFYDGNTNFTKKLVDLIKASKRNIPVIFSSSTQAALDNDYGKSKKMAEDYLLSSRLPVYVYRLCNAFGKWCRPNYNSACATFCYNIAHGLDIFVRDSNYVVTFNYVDDIVSEFIKVVESSKQNGSKDILSVQPIYECSLGKLSDLLYYFKKEVESERHIPIIHDEFELKLFKTFCDYLSDEGYSFNFAEDNRGSFEELYKSKKWGQISDNVSFPGITKGGHYHKYKKEIFYTVIGECEIIQRKIGDDKLEAVKVNGDKPNPIEIKVGYTHQITNIGKSNSHTLMWISEIYNPETHDTYREDVIK